MTYILIIFLAGSSAGVMDYIEFNDKKSCELAKEQMNKDRYASHVNVFCVEKGKK